jgi:prevent-host-death family protein
MSIGVRELRETLSEQLAAVRQGHSVTITSHGEPIARIVPVDQPTTMERLRAAGLIRPPLHPRRPLPEPIETSGPVSDLIDEQRR